MIEGSLLLCMEIKKEEKKYTFALVYSILVFEFAQASSPA